MKNKIALGSLIIGIFLTAFSIFTLNMQKATAAPDSVTVTASSTTYTLTTASQLLVATSSKRTALSVQPIGCTQNGDGVTYLNFDKGKAAVSGKGFAVFASTTQEFFDGGLPPGTYGTSGIVATGTCSVLVTEWRTNF
jgi:hypothetical protein